MSGYYNNGPPPAQGGYGQPRMLSQSFARHHLLINGTQLPNKDMASLLVSIRDSEIGSKSDIKSTD
jgi:hypothetical protein